MKIPARLALHFYCRKITINKKEILELNGPLIIAANHPNSFLDAIILATIFKCPVYSLARGDAFANKFYTKILGMMNMLPVYRISEGVENLEHNYSTFNKCQDIFNQNGIVLIFCEGRCINEWHLRSLKKGTARLAINAWLLNVPVKILPVGINYSSFRIFGKNLKLNFGKIIEQKDINENLLNGKAINAFNSKLNDELYKLVIEIEPANKEEIKKIFFIPQPLVKKLLLFIPCVIGWLLHFPLYYLIDFFIRKKAKDHYDSIMIGCLFLLYPFYLLLLVITFFMLTKSLLALSLIFIIPFTAWSLLQIKRQF